VTFAEVEAGSAQDFPQGLLLTICAHTNPKSLKFHPFGNRAVQRALKLILEPIFEADFQPGSFGYRPKKSAHAAIQRVREAIAQGKAYVIDFDLRSYFDTVRHHIVLEQVARRVDDDAVL